MRRIGTTSGGLHIVEFTESDLACVAQVVSGIMGAFALPAAPCAVSGTDGAAVHVEPLPARKAAKAAAAGGERRCIICDRPLPAKAIRGQVTCGSAPCKKQHQSNLTRRWYLKRKAEGKAVAVKATPPAAREPAPAPVVDKSARRELIRRLAEKKGLAGDADTAVGPVNDPTYVR